jgi:hypothetical protein
MHDDEDEGAYVDRLLDEEDEHRSTRCRQIIRQAFEDVIRELRGRGVHHPDLRRRSVRLVPLDRRASIPVARELFKEFLKSPASRPEKRQKGKRQKGAHTFIRDLEVRAAYKAAPRGQKTRVLDELARKWDTTADTLERAIRRINAEVKKMNAKALMLEKGDK